MFEGVLDEGVDSLEARILNGLVRVEAHPEEAARWGYDGRKVAATIFSWTQKKRRKSALSCVRLIALPKRGYSVLSGLCKQEVSRRSITSPDAKSHTAKLSLFNTNCRFQMIQWSNDSNPMIQIQWFKWSNVFGWTTSQFLDQPMRIQQTTRGQWPYRLRSTRAMKNLV